MSGTLHSVGITGVGKYFPDKVVPMLPETLSNEICSLKPGVDRLVQTVEMEITPQGRTVNYEFHDGVIRSAERMTYDTKTISTTSSAWPSSARRCASTGRVAAASTSTSPSPIF